MIDRCACLSDDRRERGENAKWNDQLSSFSFFNGVDIVILSYGLFF